MIESRRLILRQIQDIEYSDILNIYSQSNNMKFILTGKFRWTLQEVKDKWNKIKFNPQTGIGFMVVVCKQTDKIIGECGFLKSSKSENHIEIAYLIDEKFWNLGYGKEVCAKLLEYGFNTLKANEIHAGMYKDNFRSSNLVQKFGFKIISQGQTKTGIKFVDYMISKDDYQKSNLS